MSLRTPFPLPQGNPRTKFVLKGFFSNTASNANNYFGIGTSGGDLGTTEANVQDTYQFPFRVTRIHGKPYISSKSASTTIQFRVAGAGLTGGDITVTAGSSAAFDSGALNVLVPSGSACNFRCDTSGSASGNIGFSITVECESV